MSFQVISDGSGIDPMLFQKAYEVWLERNHKPDTAEAMEQFANEVADVVMEGLRFFHNASPKQT
jgi:hypothetical protein